MLSHFVKLGTMFAVSKITPQQVQMVNKTSVFKRTLTTRNAEASKVNRYTLWCFTFQITSLQVLARGVGTIPLTYIKQAVKLATFYTHKL